MNKWGLALCSIGFIIIATSPLSGGQTNSMILGILVVITGALWTFKRKKK